MKHKSKILAAVIAVILTLALGLTTGCGGCLGLIGVGGCVGSCIGALSSENILKNILSGSASDTDTEESTEETRESSSGENSSSSSGQSSASLDNLTYEEYDPTQFYADCEELSALAQAGKDSQVIEMYDKLYDEFCDIEENSTILYIIYSTDPSDEYYSEQYVSDNAMCTKVYDAIYSAIKDVTESSCADSFKKYVGEESFDAFADYEELTDEQLEYSEQESKLVDEYYTAAASVDESDYDEMYETVGPIYVELVKLRTKIAQSYGYDNYADYADAELYFRDYSAEDIESFCQSVKKLASRYYDLTYYSSASYAPYIIDTTMTDSEMLNCLQKYGSAISSISENASKLLTEKKLYNFGSDSARMSGAYTTYLFKSQVPYTFMTESGNASDLVILSHEFGHFCEYTVAPADNALLSGGGSLDLEEIHSNGMQALFTYYYSNIYGSYASIMEAYCVNNLISNVVDGCIMDEFQRQVYANPDMTLEEIDQLYKDLCSEYGDTVTGSIHWWAQIPHNFEAPMYYFSYAASGIVALQIWLDSKSDMSSATQLWENIVNAGSYEKTYSEVLDEVGVSMFTNPTFVVTLMDKALTFVENNSFSLGSWQN